MKERLKLKNYDAIADDIIDFWWICPKKVLIAHLEMYDFMLGHLIETEKNSKGSMPARLNGAIEGLVIEMEALYRIYNGRITIEEKYSSATPELPNNQPKQSKK